MPFNRTTSGAVLYKKDGKILLQHRSQNARIFPGYWGMFGGGIEGNETPEETLKRELMEEIEYKISNYELLTYDEFVLDDGGQINSYLYIAEYDESQPIIQHEGEGYGWFTIEEAFKLKLTEARRLTLYKITDYLKKKGVI